jgi:hypothetical protein
MEVHPWLPSIAQNRVSFAEASTEGSNYVQFALEPFAPLHYLDNAVASPFNSSLACDCGSLTVDGVCTSGGGVASAPFWAPSMRPSLLTMQPFETLPLLGGR